MFSLSAFISALLSLLARTFSNVIVSEVDAMRAAEAQRQVGRDQQAQASLTEAERQEAIAKAAGEAAAATVPVNDPDMRD